MPRAHPASQTEPRTVIARKQRYDAETMDEGHGMLLYEGSSQESSARCGAISSRLVSLPTRNAAPITLTDFIHNRGDQR